jgi:hypothetical protein
MIEDVAVGARRAWKEMHSTGVPFAACLGRRLLLQRHVDLINWGTSRLVHQNKGEPV